MKKHVGVDLRVRCSHFILSVQQNSSRWTFTTLKEDVTSGAVLTSYSVSADTRTAASSL